jgi:flagellar hook assembly protein FlgD
VKTTVVNRAIPTAYALNANYPNPFNPTTNISFALAEDSKVCLKIYNLSGQLVKTLVDANLSAGTYTVSWNGTNGSEEKVASGIYFYKLSAGSYSQTRKMCLLK